MNNDKVLSQTVIEPFVMISSIINCKKIMPEMMNVLFGMHRIFYDVHFVNKNVTVDVVS